MGYSINVNEHGGLSWEIKLNEIDYDTFITFIDELKNVKYNYLTKNNYGFHNGYKNRVGQKDMKELECMLTNNAKEYFNSIRSFILSNDENLEIECNSYERLTIYIMCKILSLKYETIKTIRKIIIPCTDFLPCNKGLPREHHVTKIIYDDELVCGCHFAPTWFHNNHHDNNYEDTISYSYTFRTMKIGVRILK